MRDDAAAAAAAIMQRLPTTFYLITRRGHDISLYAAF